MGNRSALLEIAPPFIFHAKVENSSELLSTSLLKSFKGRVMLLDGSDARDWNSFLIAISKMIGYYSVITNVHALCDCFTDSGYFGNNGCLILVDNPQNLLSRDNSARGHFQAAIADGGTHFCDPRCENVDEDLQDDPMVFKTVLCSPLKLSGFNSTKLKLPD